MQPYFATRAEYDKYAFKRELRLTAIMLGILMLVFFTMEFGISFVLLFIELIGGVDITLEENMPLMLLESGAISMIVFFITGLIFCLIRRVNFSEVFPFKKVGAGTLTMLVVIGITFSLFSNFAAELISNLFGLFGVDNSVDMSYDTYTPLGIFLNYFTVAIIPAFVEEFAFRGVVMGSLRKYSDGLAILISAILFALMHGNFVQIPFTFCGGLVFGFIALKANSLVPSIIVHFLNNAIATTFDILYTNKVMGEAQIDMIWCGLIIVLSILSLILARILFIKKPEFFSFTDSNTAFDGVTRMTFKEKVITVITSPTIIIFAVFMLIYAVMVLFS